MNSGYKWKGDQWITGPFTDTATCGQSSCGLFW